MKTGRNTIVLMFVVALMVLAASPLLFEKTGTANAISMHKGAEKLSQYVNSEDSNAPAVSWGNHEWHVLSYGTTGNQKVAEQGVITLFETDVHDYWDQVAFSNDPESVVYAGSNLQTTMENSYETMFTAADKAAVKTRTLAGGSDYYCICVGGEEEYPDGYDPAKVMGPDVPNAHFWPLSVSEANAIASRMLPARDSYWLRTPGLFEEGDLATGEHYRNYKAAFVYRGAAVAEGLRVQGTSRYRGAVWLKMDRVLFTSDYLKNKAAYSPVGADSVRQVEDVNNNIKNVWKLTLLDESRGGFGIRSVTSDDGKTLKINYKGATAGDNEYISVIVMGSNGEIKSYGKLALAVSGSGADAFAMVDLNGKWDPASGEKLLVFNEQCNQETDYVITTDYSSQMLEITESMIGDDGTWKGSGTKNDPYIIKSAAGWKTLVDYVEAGQSTTGKYFKLAADISVDTMVGDESLERPFEGHFDGAEHKITFTPDSSPQYCAPFRYAKNAEFANLETCGKITTSKKYAAGLIGHAKGTTNVTNCRSNIGIESSVNGDGTHGGLVARGDNKLIITGCLFNGYIEGANTIKCGGFVGWSQNSCEMKDCLFDPSRLILESGFEPLARNNLESVNCYYTKKLDGEQISSERGKQARTVTGEKGVTVGFGTPASEYDVSGITAYSKGLAYDGSFYAGKDDRVSLVLTAPGNNREYIASAGAFTHTGENYQLVMPDENVKIGYRYTRLEAPQHVSINVSASENGLLKPEKSLTAQWDIVEGADGYAIRVIRKEGGSETVVLNWIPVPGSTVSGDVASYDISKKMMDDINTAREFESGEFTFEVKAKGGSVESSAVSSSNTVELYKMRIEVNERTVTRLALSQSDIAGCITDYFSDPQDRWTDIDENGKYWFRDNDDNFVEAMAFLPKEVANYSSIAEAKKAAYLVPGESAPVNRLSRDVNVHTLSEYCLCNDGDLGHELILKGVAQPASIGPEAFGITVYTCKKCGKDLSAYIMPVKGFKLADTAYEYRGKPVEPDVIVTDIDGKSLKRGTDYDLAFSNNEKAGTASVRIKLKGKYEGEKMLTFRIKNAPGWDPNRKGTDGTAVGPGASGVAAEKAITSMRSEKDPKGSVFSKLQFRSSKQTKNSISLNWTKVKGAKKYVIYASKCGKTNKCSKLAEVTGNKMVAKKVAGKSIKKGTYYKFIIVALNKDNRVVSTGKLIHVATKGGKVGNHKSVTVKKAVINKAKKLKKGKSLSLKAKMKPQSKKLKVQKHTNVRYESTNQKIAKVSPKGIVKAKKKGSCYVYAYAQNGAFKRIKVVVK